MALQDTIEEIIKLKNALARDSDASDSEAEDLGTLSTNSGHKLLHGSRNVSVSGLRPPKQPHSVQVVNFGGIRRAVITKKRKLRYSLDAEGNPIAITPVPRRRGNKDTHSDSDDDSSPEDSLLDDVHIEELLNPITDPAMLPSHPSISQTFLSGQLRQMARQTLDIIVDEKAHVTKLANLLAHFLGDDADAILPENINLPDYETTDDGPTKEEDDAQSAQTTGDYVGITSIPTPNMEENFQNGAYPSGANTNGNSSGSAGAEASNISVPSLRRPHTRSNPRVGSFFAPPKLEIDRNYGVSAEAAEDTRQLLQIAHQRLEEFVRCVTSIRMGLTRADRRRRQVLNWCKEMNGQDYVEEEVGPDDSHLQWGVSRPLVQPGTSGISATERSDQD